MPLVLGVPRETAPGETRVATTPDAVQRLKKKGVTVRVESGAGATAGFPDAAYTNAGAEVVDRATVYQADVVAKVAAPDANERKLLRADGILISFLQSLDDLDTVQAIAKTGVTAMAMEMVPRITRAQKMDALSAMSTVAGYKAVLLAADTLPKFFPLLTTAAGTLRPAKVFIIGAGVAGLQALATARRLGAITFGYDIRTAAAEQVESVGAEFVTLTLPSDDAEDAGGYAKALGQSEAEQQIALMAEEVAKYDVVITTALIPGRPAPLLLNEDAVRNMPEGSVIIDLAAPNGGNCALTQPDEAVHAHGTTILGPTNLVASMPLHASQMYARTVMAMVLDFLTDEGTFRRDFEDEVFVGACVTHEGAVVHERVKGKLDVGSEK
ncbi:MAG: Re/Si-specific NAD(P)(+) transhydrogenase subunit alpha [Bacteroidota bacterium]